MCRGKPSRWLCRKWVCIQLERLHVWRRWLGWAGVNLPSSWLLHYQVDIHSVLIAFSHSLMWEEALPKGGMVLQFWDLSSQLSTNVSYVCRNMNKKKLIFPPDTYTNAIAACTAIGCKIVFPLQSRKWNLLVWGLISIFFLNGKIHI